MEKSRGNHDQRTALPLSKGRTNQENDLNPLVLDGHSRPRDRNLLLAEVRDYTISGPRNPVVVCFTSPLLSLTAISSPHPFCFLSTTHNLP